MRSVGIYCKVRKLIVSATAILLLCAHAQAKDSTPSKNAQVYTDFIAACTGAFALSSASRGESPTPEHLAFGKTLCECTAQESKSQKVSIAHLKKETAKIKADPKYKLSDPGLLASLQYCSMKSTEGLSPDN
jgi:hypothetical protein